MATVVGYTDEKEMKTTESSLRFSSGFSNEHD